MKWIFLLLMLFIPVLAYGQSYNALTYTAGSFNNSGCGGSGGVCSADLLLLGVQLNGTQTYCKDCHQDMLCTPGGTGSLAMMINGHWTCGFGGGANGTACTSGSFNNIGSVNALLGPGYISITGNSGNGTDQISNLNINGVINPVAYGAKCDGVTDDRVALNNALAACGSSVGNVVEIPNASCAIKPSTSHGLIIPSNCTLRGRGPQSAIVESAGSTCTTGWSGLIVNSGMAGAGNSNIAIRDLQITGIANHAGSCTGVYFNKTTGVDLDNLTVANTDSLGLIVDSSTNFKIRNNTINSPWNFGITVENNNSVSSQFTITNNTVTNSSGDSIFVALTPIPTIATSVVRGSKDFSISGNLVINAGDAGIEVGAVSNLGVQNTDFAVTGNEIDGSVNNAILIRNDARWSVTGNVARNNGTSGGATAQDEISIYSAEANVQDGTVSGNSLTPAFGSGVGFTQGADLAGNKYSIYNVTVTGNRVTFSSGAYTCSGRNGSGVSVGLFGAGAASSQNIDVTGNVLSGIPCVGIQFSGLSQGTPLWGAIAANNTITGQNTTSTTGVSCGAANCVIQGNVLAGLNVGISDAFANALQISGNEFIGAINTGYTHNSSTFAPMDTNQTLTKTGAIYGTGFTPSISGGGTLATGSNSVSGRVTGSAATNNVLTPGFTCPNAVQGVLEDDTTNGGAKITGQTTTTLTFSATSADVIDYMVSCR